VAPAGVASAAPSACGHCRLPAFSQDTCISHVRWLQNHGRTCKEALDFSARLPPVDCGCTCDSSVCLTRRLGETGDAVPSSAIYLNNCKWGLHGPIEVLTREAVAAFLEREEATCQELRERQWGEDKYMRNCLKLLHVRRVDEFGLLSEKACDQEPSPCDAERVAFHPFKTPESYNKCWDYAQAHGRGPEGSLPAGPTESPTALAAIR